MWQRARDGTSPSASGTHGFRGNVFAGGGHGSDAIVESHESFGRAYAQRMGRNVEGMRCGMRVSPSPFVVPRAKLQEMADLQSALAVGLKCALRSWSDPGSRIRREVTLTPRAAGLLLGCAEFASGLPSVSLPLGSFRPDVLIGDDGRLRVCEINARFALNGFLVTSACVEALHSAPSDSLLGSMGLGVVPATQSLLSDVASRFDASETIFAIVGRERLNDLAVLNEMFESHGCIFSIEYVRPEQLVGHADGSLACTLDGGNEQLVPVRQCILELHQDELLNLPNEVLRGLLALSVKSRCLNPVWTILLCHDKRMLGVLRTLTAEELPDENVRRVLRAHIVPTTHLRSADELKQLMMTQRGMIETTLVAKPLLLGKGEGIIMEKDFGTPEEFVVAVSEAADEMLRDAGEDVVAAFPYVIQTYVKQERFSVVRPPSDDPSLTPVDQPVVATLLCLDDSFLGPGIFRSSANDVVALCNGGMMLAPALALPCAQPHLRFFSRDLQDVDADGVRKALVDDGMALVCLGRPASDPTQFEAFVRDRIGGDIHRHSSTVGGVWDIRPTSGGGARSHTSDPFLPHTDASFEPTPPRFFALSVVRGDRGCGGLLGFASIEEAVGRLSDEHFDVLRNTVVRWRRPAEFTKDGEEPTIEAPVLFSRRRARVRTDIIGTDHLSAADGRRFWEAYQCFYSHLEEMCRSSARLFPEQSIILMDNQAFVHARTQIVDPRRHLLRLRFDLPQSPELTSLLDCASCCSGARGAQSCRLDDWPIQSKADYMASVNSGFEDRLRSCGGLYWSPSGGTTSANNGAEACAIPSSNRENTAMRKGLIDLLCGVGAIPRDGSSSCVAINLFASGGLHRSLEIFGDVFAAVNATHLPLGSGASDNDVIRCIERFGVDTLCGWGSRILQLCESARKRQALGAMDTIKTIIHGGEKLTKADRSLVAKACGGSVRIFGCYGSAEAGVFAVSLGANDSDNEKYALLDDMVHVEIVSDDDCGAVKQGGRIVVTNLNRKLVQPLVRFDTGDIGRLVRGRPGYYQVLEVFGRSDRASAFRVNLNACSNFIHWEDIEEVMRPLSKMAAEFGATCLAQIVIPATKAITLAIFTSLPRTQAFSEVATLCSIAFSDYVSRLGAEVDAKTCFLDEMSQLVRSPRSQKLMMWVDMRC